MAKKKLTQEEKRTNARNHILAVSFELFFTKGFNETTTREIITKAGILNGSLYNRFKNKDDILSCLLKEATETILSDCEKLMQKEKNMILVGAFPGALQIYLSSHSENLAKLIYTAHGKWETVMGYATINLEWSEKFFSDYGYSDLEPELLLLKEISLLGFVGNTIGYYVNGGGLPYKTAIREYLLQFSASFNLPCMNADSLVDKLCEIMDSLDLVFLGHDLRKELPEFSG